MITTSINFCRHKKLNISPRQSDQPLSPFLMMWPKKHQPSIWHLKTAAVRISRPPPTAISTRLSSATARTSVRLSTRNVLRTPTTTSALMIHKIPWMNSGFLSWTFRHISTTKMWRVFNASSPDWIRTLRTAFANHSQIRSRCRSPCQRNLHQISHQVSTRRWRISRSWKLGTQAAQ